MLYHCKSYYINFIEINDFNILNTCLSYTMQKILQVFYVYVRTLIENNRNKIQGNLWGKKFMFT